MEINKTKKEKFFEYGLIVKRAEEMMGKEYTGMTRLSLIMDIELADEIFHLRLEDWYRSDELNFVHDWNGIHSHINRQTKTFDETFIPRFIGKEA